MRPSVGKKWKTGGKKLIHDKRSRNCFHCCGDTECLTAAEGYTKAFKVQRVLTGDKGPPVVLRGLSSSSLCSEVYTAAGFGPGLWNDCFYLICNSKRFPTSDVPVYPYLDHLRAVLRQTGRLWPQ